MRESRIFGRIITAMPLALLFVASAFGQIVIYDNGGLATGATTRSGVAAPAGTQWSEIQNNSGNTTEANTLAGVGCQLIGVATLNRCADSFSVPAGQVWTISAIRLFGYQTGNAGAVSPFTGVNLQIWNGPPLEAGSTVVFGDTTTNRLASSTNSGLFRAFNSTIPAPGTVPGTTRVIWQNEATIAPALLLNPGTYWIDFQMDAGATGNFTPTNTTVGTRGGSLYEGRQKTTAATTFAPILETGNPATAPDYGVKFPFKIVGTVTNSSPNKNQAKTSDFNNDGRTDLAIASSASATGQTTWRIFDGAVQTNFPFGLGVGFPTGDKAVPADYDGDGRTDIAIWRPGAQGFFYIFQSQTSTVRIDAFGITGDDSSVVGDYDGDDKADVAVYRPGAAGTFYYRTTAGGPTTFLPWGTTGDVAVPGDYDGDKKHDAAIVRNAGGSAQHWRRSSAGGGTVVTNFGLFTDKFVPGDYDGDRKTDIATVRTEGADLAWYILKSGGNGVSRIPWGAAATDFIAQGDYDGDQRTDPGVWRSGAGADQGYFLAWGTSGPYTYTKWGNSSGTLTAPDYPVANYNVR